MNAKRNVGWNACVTTSQKTPTANQAINDQPIPFDRVKLLPRIWLQSPPDESNTALPTTDNQAIFAHFDSFHCSPQNDRSVPEHPIAASQFPVCNFKGPGVFNLVDANQNDLER